MQGRSDSGTWSPILDGELEAAAVEAVAAIAHDLVRCIDQIDETQFEPSLGGGLSGQALFLATLSDYHEEPAFITAASRALELALRRAHRGSMDVGLLGGLAGLGWVIHETRVEDGEDLSERVDRSLLRWVARPPVRNYDLMDGLVGIGVYALDRHPQGIATRSLEHVLEHLEQWSELREDGRTWKTPSDLLAPWDRAETPDGHYNLGLAHGVPGVVAWLASAVRIGFVPARCTELLDHAIAWLIRQARVGCVAARTALWYADGAELRGYATPLGWCYGDPGVGIALLRAGVSCNRSDWRSAGETVLARAAACPVDDAGVKDACLCHGSAGLAHIFNRAYQTTRDDRFLEAAKRWFAAALASRRVGAGIGGFSSWIQLGGGWRDDASYLTGSAGVGLALLSAICSDEPTWDHPLLLSSRPAA